jgi:hypothetical protein
MSWTDRSAEIIAQIHATLPADAPYADREKALRDGYPFSQRRGWAYKAWLKARRAYLSKYGTEAIRPKGDKQANFDTLLSPLDRAKAKGDSLSDFKRRMGRS